MNQVPNSLKVQQPTLLISLSFFTFDSSTLFLVYFLFFYCYKMQPSTLFVWLFTATAAAAAAVGVHRLPSKATPHIVARAPVPTPPVLPGTRGKTSINPLPGPEALVEKKAPLISRCIQGCLNARHGEAGCGSPNDWSCLCS